MQKVVAVKKDFDKDNYYFLADENIKIGDKVVISLDEFQTIGTVKNIFDNTGKFEKLSSIKRIANENDLKKFDDFKEKAKARMSEIKTKSIKLGLMMKFIGAEYSLDGSKIIIVFSSEDRVDFRQFLKELASMLKVRIELKQIGQRDEVKVCGGVGPCGEECCCARFLKDFEHVSVKMAKTQGLSLAPTKINGICGRLMCCLAYESNQYEEILKKMPKVGSEVSTPNGKGVVSYNDILRERVSVKRQTDGDSFVVEDFALEEISGKNFAKKPFEKHENNKPQEKVFEKEIKNDEKKQETNINGSSEGQNDKSNRPNKKFNRKNFKFKKNKS